MESIGQLIATLFLDRDLAHREHLRTRSYAAHVALNGFYDTIVDMADKLAEAYQGRHGVIEDIPLMSNDVEGDIVDVLEMHLASIEDMRYDAIDKADTPLQNIIDEIVGVYLSALYKLKTLD